MTRDFATTVIIMRVTEESDGWLASILVDPLNDKKDSGEVNFGSSM